MKILYVCSDHGVPVFGDKGASIHVREMLSAFHDLGHQVLALAARVGSPDPSFPIRVQAVRTELPVPVGDRHAKEMRYLALGDAMEDAIANAVEAERPDFIYERCSLWSAAGVRAGARLGVPVVLEVNAPLVHEQRRYRKLVLEAQAERIEAENYLGATIVQVVSQPLVEYVHQRAPEAVVAVVPNGVDTRRFLPDADAAVHFEPDSFVVGFSGSLRPWHGIGLLLEAFRDLSALHADARLLIVGDGPERRWIEGFVAGADLETRVRVTGWVSHDEIPAHLRAMDVALAPYPSSEPDGFYFSPLKLFEYMASGRAIVASGLGQIGEVLEDGRTALLPPPGSVDALVDAIEALRADPALRASLGQAAARAAEGRDWRVQARATCERVLGQRRKANVA